MNDWITVGALAEGFAPDSFILPPLADLAGHQYQLYFSNGWQIEHHFTADQVSWKAKDGHSSGQAPYRASSVREGLYLIDFVKFEEGQHWSISLILDTHQGIFTAVIGSLPNAEQTARGLYQKALAGEPLTGVQAEFLHGSLDQPHTADRPQHLPTSELVGKRNMYRYSPTEVYEHIYLNEGFYSWQCLKGVEAGLADTDRCHYYKLADELYLFVWQEKIIPTLGLVLIDLQQHRSDGKLFGYEGGSFDTISNFPISSYCSLLNVTEYPQ